MTKYKAGDKVTIVLDNRDAEKFNEYEDEYTIIAHEAAPEPIVRYLNILRYSHGLVYEHSKDADIYDPNGDRLGQIKVTITGNDFTVEKVSE